IRGEGARSAGRRHDQQAAAEHRQLPRPPDQSAADRGEEDPGHRERADDGRRGRHADVDAAGEHGQGGRDDAVPDRDHERGEDEDAHLPRQPRRCDVAHAGIVLACPRWCSDPRADEGGRMDRNATLREVEQRVLWLATSIVHHANRVRPNPDGLKVGGHQASSASLVSIMTELWFNHLHPEDRVSVKPHASPVLHAINYLLGELSAPQLETLRAFGGLQSYPSRAKDPDTVDYSTGSVGIGATAPIWGAVSRRYVGSMTGGDVGGRQYSLVGDAELDEGAVWEAVLDPAVAELGEVVWIVDFNRQSLDRVVPNIGAPRLQGMFAAAGWQVLTVKYG